MKMDVKVLPYSRAFREPLQTAHGLWKERRGFLIKITGKEGGSGYGEVAPAPWLGSETIQEAEEFLRWFASGCRPGRPISDVIGDRPACRFGIDCAMSEIRSERRSSAFRPIEVAALLPAGRSSLDVVREKFAAGFRTFKWKIAVERAALEREIYRELRASVSSKASFRLDANGGLTPLDAREWLALLDEIGAEFLEQPLPPDRFEEMRALSEQFETPIALDESVGYARQFESVHRSGWKGIYVIKPSLFGAMREVASLLPALRPRLVFSSAFETSAGYENVLRWASRWQAEGVAPGLGTGEFLKDDGLFTHPCGPTIMPGAVDPGSVWERLTR